MSHDLVVDDTVRTAVPWAVVMASIDYKRMASVRAGRSDQAEVRLWRRKGEDNPRRLVLNEEEVIRPATTDDLRYVLHSWARAAHDAHASQQHLSRQGPACSQAVWLRLFSEVQRRVLERAQCLVFTNPEDDTQVLGYAIGETGTTPVLWYTQVKKDAWRKGIAKALLAELGITSDKPCIYAFASPAFRIIKRPLWTHVPWYLIPAKELT